MTEVLRRLISINQYKNKNVLIEVIHKEKAEVKREKELEAQRAARREKNAVRK